MCIFVFSVGTWNICIKQGYHSILATSCSLQSRKCTPSGGITSRIHKQFGIQMGHPPFTESPNFWAVLWRWAGQLWKAGRVQLVSRESCFHYLCIWVLIRYAILLGWCIKQSKERVFFYWLCELLHFFLDLCYIWLMWVLKAWSFSVRSILRPSESLGDSPQSWWWLFCASVNPGRVSSASTRVPRFAFCDVVQICKCVCVCV